MQALRAGFKLVDSNRKNDGKRRNKIISTSDRSILPMIDFVDSNGIISPVNNITTWDPFEYDKNEQQQLNDSSRVKNPQNWQHIEHDESKRYDLDRAASVTYSSKAIPATGDFTTRWQPFAEYERNMETLPIEHDFRRQPIDGELVKNSPEIILSNDSPPPIKYQTRWQPIEHDEGTQPLSGRTANCFKETKPFHHDSGDTQLKNTNWKRKSRTIKGDDNSVDRSAAFQKSDKDNINKRYSQSPQPAEIFDPFYIHDTAKFSQPNCEGLFEQCDIFEEKQTDNNLHHFSNEMEPNPKQDRLYKEKEKQSQNSQPRSRREILEYDIEFDDNVFNSFKSMETSSRREETSCRESKIQHDHLFHQSHIESSASEFSEGSILQQYPKISMVDKESTTSLMVATDRNQDLETCFEHNSASESGEEFDKENKLFRQENACDRNKILDSERRVLNSDTLVTTCENGVQEKKKIFELVDESGCLEVGLGPGEIGVNDTGHHQDTLEVGVSPRDVAEEEEEEEGGRFDQKLIVLLSKFSGTLQQRTKQDRALSILKGRKINNIEEVDGSAPINKDLRNLLFGISGVRGDYPQFFLLNDQDNVIYLGNYDWIEHMNDIGSFTNEEIFGVPALTSKEESPKAEVVDDSPITATDYDIRKSLSSNSHPESTEALVFFKNETIQDDGHIGEISVKLEKSSCVGNSVNLPIDLVTDEINPRASRDVPYIDTYSIEIESQGMDLVQTGIEVAEADVDDVASMEPFNTQYVSENDRGSERYVNKLHDAVKSSVPNIDSEFFPKPEDKLDIYMENDNDYDKSAVEESSEEHVRTPSKRKMILSSIGSLLDTDAENNSLIDPKQVQAISLSVTCSQSVSPTIFYEQSYDVEEGGNNSRETDVNVTPGILQKIDRPLGRENDDDDDCSKPDVPKVGSDRAREGQEKSRKRRWKRLLLAEHDKKQSGGKGKTLSRERTDGKSPVGSSLSEINMINIFLSVAEPYFDGSGSRLSTQECTELHGRARNAGLTETFTDKMLDQSAGILMYERNAVRNVSKIETSPSGRSFQTKSTTASSSSDYVYDEDGFTRKTPEAQSKFGCFKSAFWAESSNIVGAEIIENVKSALSGDSESVSSRWVGAEMIENIKSSFSGDSESVSSRWAGAEMIENVRSALSGDSESVSSRWRSK